MPPKQQYEWLCLRALKARQCRNYATSQTSRADETAHTSTPPLSPTTDTSSPTQSTRTKEHIRSYLEEQDTIALSNLKTKVQQIQTNAALAESLLSSYRASTSTVKLIPSIPRYNVVRSHNSRIITESHALTRNLQHRTQVVLDNIWDLENIPYPYEKGPSVAEKYKVEVKALVERGVKQEIEAERTEMRNRVDVYQKRFAQKAAGLRGIVAEMRMSMGLDALAGSTRTGSVVKGFAGQKKVEVVEMRNSFARKEGVKEVADNAATAAAATTAGEATIGAAKVEAEADAINPVNIAENTPENEDTIGTVKIEAEAQEAQVEAAKPPTNEPTMHGGAQPTAEASGVGSYTPMIAVSTTPSTESEIAVAETPTKKPARTNNKSFVSSVKKAPPPNSAAKSREPAAGTITSSVQINQLLQNLQAEAAQLREDMGSGQAAMEIAEKKDVDEWRENPFAR